MIGLSRTSISFRFFQFATLGILASSMMALPIIPPGGPEEFVVETEHEHTRCIDLPRCPGSRNQSGVFGTECGYCQIERTQAICSSEGTATCRQREYRQGAPTCGTRWISGEISAAGHCVGAVASGVCYRVTCTEGEPVAE